MNARTQALLADFILWALAGFAVAAIPVLELAMQAGPDQFNWRSFLWALLTALVTGLIGAVRKYVAPQLVSIQSLDEINGGPSLVGVSLKDIKPAPAKIDQIRQKPPSLATLEKAGVEKVDE